MRLLFTQDLYSFGKEIDKIKEGAYIKKYSNNIGVHP
jgi:hypothetical protein